MIEAIETSSNFVAFSSNFADIFGAFENIAKGLKGFVELVPGAK